MRPLIITEETIERTNEVVEWAHNHPYTMDDLFDIRNGSLLPPGDNEKFVTNIDLGYRVVYSLENQNRQYKHISISVDDEHKFPSIDAVKEITKLFGFINPLETCKICPEYVGTRRIIHIYDDY